MRAPGRAGCDRPSLAGAARAAALALLCVAPATAPGRAAARSVAADAARPAGVSPGELDEQRAAWRHRRAVEVSDAEGLTLAALPLPPELRASSAPDLRDLRLVDAQGREVPYTVDRQTARETAPEWSGSLADARREARRSSQWVVDLGAPRAFEQVMLDVPGDRFAKRLRLEAADDGRAWRVLRDDAGVFARDWHGPLRHTVIDLDAPARARWLRLTADDRRSRPIDVAGVRVRGVRRLGEARWRIDAPLGPAPAPEAGRSRYGLALPAGLPIEAIEIDAADLAFSRSVRLVEAVSRDGRREERALGQARLFRVRLDDPALAAEALRFDVRRPEGGELWLEVDDGDSPPLRELRVSVSGTAERLLFPAASGAYTLYYGNPATRAPLYDLEALRGRLGFAPRLAEARLGDEAPNPRHSPAPPLAFVPTAGAALEAALWRFARPFEVGPREDIYSLTLAAEDLGRLRDDLGDVRLADAEGRQVPYFLDPAAAEARVSLAVEPAARGGYARARRGDRAAATSRWRLVPGPPGDAAPAARRAMPLAALELDFREGFFARPARVLAPGPARGGETAVYRGRLARAAGSRGPLVLTLDGRRHAQLWLEVDEGDNAPLTPAAALAVVRVPRVTFKARPGQYRLLLGNDEAAPPRYDLATLRRELLAYSALAVEPGPAADNPAYRRRAADYFKSAPPTLLLWATLAAAVVGLLLLTARVLRKAAG